MHLICSVSCNNNDANDIDPKAHDDYDSDSDPEIDDDVNHMKLTCSDSSRITHYVLLPATAGKEKKRKTKHVTPKRAKKKDRSRMTKIEIEPEKKVYRQAVMHESSNHMKFIDFQRY